MSITKILMFLCAVGYLIWTCFPVQAQPNQTKYPVKWTIKDTSINVIDTGNVCIYITGNKLGGMGLAVFSKQGYNRSNTRCE